MPVGLIELGKVLEGLGKLSSGCCHKNSREPSLKYTSLHVSTLACVKFFVSSVVRSSYFRIYIVDTKNAKICMHPSLKISHHMVFEGITYILVGKSIWTPFIGEELF